MLLKLLPRTGGAGAVKSHTSAPRQFAPPLFCLYLLAMPFLGKSGCCCLLPLGLRLVILLQAAVLALPGSVVQSICAIPLIVLTHILYGVGFRRGLFHLAKADPHRPQNRGRTGETSGLAMKSRFGPRPFEQRRSLERARHFLICLTHAAPNLRWRKLRRNKRGFYAPCSSGSQAMSGWLVAHPESLRVAHAGTARASAPRAGTAP